MKRLLRTLAILLLVVAISYSVHSFLTWRQSGGPDQQGAGAGDSRSQTTKAASVPADIGNSWEQTDDPASDGWDTEVFAEKAKKQLEALGKLVIDPAKKIDPSALAELITNDFACQALQPTNLRTVFDDQHLKVERLPVPSSDPDGGDLPHRGAAGLTETLETLASSFSGASDLRYKAKIFRVYAGTNELKTRQYFSVSGRTKSGMIEHNATWDVGWASGSEGDAPRMRFIRVAEFEQTTSRQPEGPLFADCTESVLGGNTIYKEQFLRGMNHWLERLQAQEFALLSSPGIAVGDVNGDGLDDLYVCQEAGLPNRLFIQKPDGSAVEESLLRGVDWLDSSRSALLVDLDNDADQDLVVAVFGGVVLAENDGSGRFKLRDVLPCADNAVSLSAVDFDTDGKLDIYVCAYSKQRELENPERTSLPGVGGGLVVHDADTGGANILFRNMITGTNGWSFEDVTDAVGMGANNHGYSFASAWEDFDNDGDPDLYVANDYGADRLYRNDGGQQGQRSKFVEISESASIESSAFGMSITWGDYDRDGWMDAYVGNMWSSAGNRITFQENFKPEAPREIKKRYQRLARGNTLLRNLGDGKFVDESSKVGVEMGRWSWGSQFVDVNNDGWEDLIAANGYITTDDTGDL